MKIKSIFLIILCAVILSACGSTDENEEVNRTVFAMDTVMDLRAYGKNARKAVEEAENEIKRLDNALSRGQAGSDVYRINESGSAEVTAETDKIVREALSVSDSTNGAFDISIAPVMDLWGFFTKDFHVPQDGEIKSTLEKVNYKNISVNGNTVTAANGSQIDLGGIAKGYLSGRIIEIFKDCGVKSAIVSLGGNVHALGTKTDGSKWNVAIQNPDGGDFLGKVSVEDMAVITSGGYQRFFERDGKIYHHIIDPKTGVSADSGLKSVTIISDNSMLADGLSTALYVMGLEDGMEYWRLHDGFEVVFMTDDNKIYITKGLESIWESSFDYEVID